MLFRQHVSIDLSHLQVLHHHKNEKRNNCIPCVNFSSFLTRDVQKTHPVTGHMTSLRNIYALIHSHFLLSFLYSWSRLNVNLCTHLLPSCSAVFYYTFDAQTFLLLRCRNQRQRSITILSYCFCVWTYFTENTATVAILETEQINKRRIKERTKVGRNKRR